jgi:pyrophosphate--fructose-6-phosphate 1-phosphotransferase
MMLHIERRKGEDKPVIKKALVDLKGKPFGELKKVRKSWAENEKYLFPGPIQYFGPKHITNTTTETLKYEHK